MLSNEEIESLIRQAENCHGLSLDERTTLWLLRGAELLSEIYETDFHYLQLSNRDKLHRHFGAPSE